MCGFFQKYGFVRISWAMVVDGPWPGYTIVEGGSGMIFPLMLAISCPKLPPGRSVRPMLPWKSTSPEMSALADGM